MRNRNLLQIVMCMVFITLCFAACNTQQPAEKINTSATFTFMGKIKYMERTNNYMVSGVNPPDEFIVENSDPKILADLAKSGKAVNIKGHTTIDADQLFIEEIDGQKYPSAAGAK